MDIGLLTAGPSPEANARSDSIGFSSDGGRGYKIDAGETNHFWPYMHTSSAHVRKLTKHKAVRY